MSDTLFEQLGGEAGVTALSDRFYDAMDARSDAATIRAMHPPDLTESRRRFALFLRMWTGGPDTYTQERGHPRLRRRHLPFAVDDAAARAWLACMAEALEDQVEDEALRSSLFASFTRVAAHMVNR